MVNLELYSSLDEEGAQVSGCVAVPRFVREARGYWASCRARSRQRMLVAEVLAEREELSSNGLLSWSVQYSTCETDWDPTPIESITCRAQTNRLTRQHMKRLIDRSRCLYRDAHPALTKRGNVSVRIASASCAIRVTISAADGISRMRPAS
jgi:hypothetical protein